LVGWISGERISCVFSGLSSLADLDLLTISDPDLAKMVEGFYSWKLCLRDPLTLAPPT